MRGGTDRALGIGAGQRRVVQQAHDGVAVLHRSREPVLRQTQVERDRLQHARAGCLERGIERLEGLAEPGDLGRPEVRRHVFGERMTLGQRAADVPEFLQVMDRSVLGLLGSERGIAARAATAGDVVGALDLVRQGEERLGKVFRLRDQVGRDAVVADHREAVFLEAAPDLFRDFGQRAGDGNGSDLGHVLRLNKVGTGLPAQRSSDWRDCPRPARAGPASR